MHDDFCSHTWTFIQCSHGEHLVTCECHVNITACEFTCDHFSLCDVWHVRNLTSGCENRSKGDAHANLSLGRDGHDRLGGRSQTYPFVGLTHQPGAWIQKTTGEKPVKSRVGSYQTCHGTVFGIVPNASTEWPDAKTRSHFWFSDVTQCQCRPRPTCGSTPKHDRTFDSPTSHRNCCTM